LTGKVILRAALVAAMFAIACGFGTEAAVADTGGQAVTYQLDAAHDGYQPSPGFTVPLQRQWSVEEPYYMGNYPLIANGVIYIVVGGDLSAIDLSTGQTLWKDPSIAPNFVIPGLAYGDGQVYAVTGATAYDQVSPGQSAGTGVLTAFNAATGAVDWTAYLPGEFDFPAAPTASNGYVYLTGDGWGAMVYSVSEATGQLAWSQFISGSATSPAVTASGVYTGFGCGLADDFSPSTGSLVWSYDAGCVGGATADSVIGDGNFYTLNAPIDALVLSPGSGELTGSFGGPQYDYPSSLAVGDGFLYTVNNGTLVATADDGLGAVAWSFGNGTLIDHPLIAGSVVFADDSSGDLYAVDASTGALLWSTTFPHDCTCGALAVADQHLVVASGGALTAYTGVPVPSSGSSGSGSGGSTSTGPGSTDAKSSAPAPGAPGDGGPTNSADSATQVTRPAIAPRRLIPRDQRPPKLPARAYAGHRIRARAGAWKPTPHGYRYEWLLCARDGTRCHAVRNAKNSSFRPGRPAIGHDLRVRVWALDSSGVSAPATSRPSSVRS